MAIVNQHINEFLDYYLNLNEPQYAVLLSGKWGSGKTHFINQFKGCNTKYKYIHISLFGLKAKDDIHKQVIFKLFGSQSNAVSTTMDIAGKLIKGFLNKYTGVNITLADIPIDIALKRESDQKVIFIFDDIERIDTGIKEVLGYINVLVEELNQKVILLANEDEIHKQEYNDFKEKTIGKTFQIEQDFDIAFTTFLNELKNSKEILQNNQSVIKSVYETAGFNNLRSLRQGMLDFDRLINSLEDKFKSHTELMIEIIQIFFALTFEVKSGKLDIHTLKDMDMLRIGRMLNEKKSDEDLTYIEKVFHKYSFLSYELLLSCESWIELFTLGILSSERISFDLNRSRYFLEEQREEWIKLYHWYDLEDKQFSPTLSDVLSKLQKNEYLQPEIFMHIVGILLDLSKERYYDKTVQEIIDDMKSYIDRNSHQWIDLYQINAFQFARSYGSMGYHSLKTEEFQEIKQYLLDEAEKTIIALLPKEGKNLLQSLAENDIETFQDLFSESKNSSYRRFPVFTAIDTQAFLDTLIQIPNRNMRYIFGVLESRYEKVNLLNLPSITDELEFWKNIQLLLQDFIQSNPSKIKTFWIKDFSKGIEKEIIQRIETHLQQIEKEKNNVE